MENSDSEKLETAVRRADAIARIVEATNVMAQTVLDMAKHQGGAVEDTAVLDGASDANSHFSGDGHDVD